MRFIGRHLIALSTAGLLAFAACGDEGEDTGEMMEADTLLVEDEDLGDQIGEGLEETGEAIGEGIEETGEAIKEGAEAVNP